MGLQNIKKLFYSVGHNLSLFLPLTRCYFFLCWLVFFFFRFHFPFIGCSASFISVSAWNYFWFYFITSHCLGNSWDHGAINGVAEDWYKNTAWVLNCCYDHEFSMKLYYLRSLHNVFCTSVLPLDLVCIHLGLRIWN